ncbi:metallophosphoesterase family protein [Arthrobacter sp. MDB2-24]
MTPPEDPGRSPQHRRSVRTDPLIPPHTSPRPVSRRRLLQLSLAAATVAAVHPLTGCSALQYPNPQPTRAVPATTRERSVRLGTQLSEGLPYRVLENADGLETLLREDLASRPDGAGSEPVARAAFGHITDPHILDATNPGRLSFLWQYLDFDDGYPTSGRFRPQDVLTLHVLNATVRAFNALGRGPESGRPLDGLVITGDVTNSFCASELDAAVATLDGGNASSNPVGSYQGIQDHGRSPRALAADVWHPDPEPDDAEPDNWKKQYGYPTVPGLLAAASSPIDAPGAAFPRYLGFGNHDETGRFGGSPMSAGDRLVDLVRTGSRLPVGLPDGMNESEFWKQADGSKKDQERLIAEMPSRTVAASSAREVFDKPRFRAALVHPDAPVDQPTVTDALHYAFDLSADVRGIMLNTASPDGGGRAVLDRQQASWLIEQLHTVSSAYLDDEGEVVRADVEDKLVVLFSHHPLRSFDDDASSKEDGGESIARDDVLGIFKRFPNLVLWMNGHEHRHRIEAHRGHQGSGGFWEITTASLIDFPQQSRVIELLDNLDGTLSIHATLVDHSSADDVRRDADQTPRSLAALSMELAANRPGLKAGTVMGGAEDQNVELLVPAPF